MFSMERIKHKSKKDKANKHDKAKNVNNPYDVKTIKENIKIKEILRTVKINSSMRVKAPKGSKIMNSKDLDVNESDDVSDSVVCDDSVQGTSQTVTNGNAKDVVRTNVVSETTDSQGDNGHEVSVGDETENNDQFYEIQPEHTRRAAIIKADATLPRSRKLSLDHSFLRRGSSLSQSEVDLKAVGKQPLERKSSFFKKKMDSFIRNTSEIFKRSSGSSLKGAGSVTGSLQSLHEINISANNGYATPLKAQIDYAESSNSLSSTVAYSSSSVTGSQSESLNQGEQADQISFSGSQPTLFTSQPLGEFSDSMLDINSSCLQDTFLNSRAISMNSGLDTAFGDKRRYTSRTNRMTWVASEGLSNYFRRMIQDEKSKKNQTKNSLQDFGDIPESKPYTVERHDSKGSRRVSYQRAVSGDETSRAKRDSVVSYELSQQLAAFNSNGVPPLRGFEFAPICDDALWYLQWAYDEQNLENMYDWKKLSPNDESRQAVIRELVKTEADYIRHLWLIVEVFIAAAHALQDSGKLLDLDTEKLFSNIPDVLNASLYFWEASIYPMLKDAVDKSDILNTELMYSGFYRFRELFHPYEKYVTEQTKLLDYLRSLNNNLEFALYLNWCHSNKSIRRLQLSDILVKPMQRLTKYSMILQRIISHTDTEPERTNLIAMVTFVKNYVLDLNRSIRQKEELKKLDHLAEVLDVLDIDFKDEELDRLYRSFCNVNLKAPMLGCLPHHSRTIVHQGDLRFKDNLKEIEVRVILLTDMMLITKKVHGKGTPYQFKMVRPKYMVHRMLFFPQYRGQNEMHGIAVVILDDVGTAYNCFMLSESAKDPQSSLKVWELKIREARMTYDLGVWYARNPSSEIDLDSSSDYSIHPAVKSGSEEGNVEREARERFATMIHQPMSASMDYDNSQTSVNTESFDAEASGSGVRTPGMFSLRHPMHRNSTGGSSRNSRLSSFQQSISAASHDEPQSGTPKNLYCAGSSVEHVIPPKNPDDDVTSITVNVLSENETENVVPKQLPAAHRPPSRSSSTTKQTLRVHPTTGVLALVHSLPDLTRETGVLQLRPMLRRLRNPAPQTASDKLYQSHQELLNRNRLTAGGSHSSHYLSPDQRGTSYPPPSPNRALKRGLAFSYSMKNPPLSKMGHVNSQSQAPSDAPSTSHGQKHEKEKGAVNPVLVPPPMPDGKQQKGKKSSSKHVFSKNKSDKGNKKDDKSGPSSEHQ